MPKTETETKQEIPKTKANPVELSEAEQTQTANASGSIDLLLGMNVPVTIAIGQKQIPIQQLLQLGPGSVLELDKSINEPVELYLRGSKFATGEVVIVQERFAVKIKEITGLEVPENENKQKKENE